MVSNPRQYYGPSMEDPRYQEATWSNRSPEPFYESSAGTVALAALGVGGVIGTGFIPTRNGRVWDSYLTGIRTAEEYSPGRFLRTFQASTFFSQFGTEAKVGLAYSAEQLGKDKHLTSYLTNLIGEILPGGDTTTGKLLREGVQLKDGKLLFGGGTVALPYASAFFSAPSTTEHLGSAYSRTIGGKGFGFSLSSDKGISQIIGGRTLGQHIGRQAGAWGTEFVSRFNRLLETPLQMEPFQTAFSKLNEVLLKSPLKTTVSFAVKEGTGLEMLGRLGVKYGLGLGALTLGYKTADHIVRNTEFLDGSIFEEGLTAAAGTVAVKTNLAASRLAEFTGAHSYREGQEEIAPGSTSLQKLLAFPIMGALGGGSIAYFTRVAKAARMQMDGATAAEATAKAMDEMNKFGGKFAHLEQLISKRSGLFSRQDWVGKLVRKISTTSGDDVSYKFIGKIGPVKLAAGLGAMAGAALISPFLPGALVPSQRPEELEDIYSGRKEVAVRRGRWWEMGRSPLEGENETYFRPHWFPRMLGGARREVLYGDENPITSWLSKEFTYDWEMEHYRDRPYPITSLPFEDVPLVGPLLANTIGRLIKPPKLMHTDEWMGEDGQMMSMPTPFGERRATELGEIAPSQPISPYSAKSAIGEQAYRLTEMMGLPGFAMSAIKEKLTGTPDLFDQYSQLESARRAFGAERAYWDLELGGMLGTSEAVRRLYPHRRRQMPLYNPIRNTMPDWLPGAGDKSPDFQSGDPYTKVPEGELRLPGPGYATRFPELEGVDPEDYPLIHKYKILADIALYSSQFKEIQQQTYAMRNSGSWTDYDENIFSVTKEQMQARKERKEFNEYQYLNEIGGLGSNTPWGGANSSDLISTLNRMKTQGADKPSLFAKYFGGYWEALSHNAETAADQLTPASPAAKLIHQRTAIEDYERTQLYGTSSSFWNHPWRDFLRPSLHLLGRHFGFEGTPGHIEDQRRLESYFDTLSYVKNARLANLAKSAGDIESQRQFESNKDETLFGINPYTMNHSHIFRSLPRRDRDYFNAFSQAATEEERGRILEMVPDNQKALYVARWRYQFATDLKQAEKAGILSETQITEASGIIEDLYDDAQAEGFPTSKELNAEYLATRLDGESYADWYRRTRILKGTPLPGPDWVGWHPSVDLEDIKLKVVQSLGEDMHSYDLWSSRAQVLNNKPFIDDEAVRAVTEPQRLSDRDMQDRINQILAPNGIKASLFMRGTGNGRDEVNVDLEQDRDYARALKEII